MLAIYSLGLGVPFIVAALAVEPFAAFLARFRAHLGLVEKAMGGLLVLTGIAFLTGTVSQVELLAAGYVPDARQDRLNENARQKDKPHDGRFEALRVTQLTWCSPKPGIPRK